MVSLVALEVRVIALFSFSQQLHTLRRTGQPALLGVGEPSTPGVVGSEYTR